MRIFTYLLLLLLTSAVSFGQADGNPTAEPQDLIITSSIYPDEQRVVRVQLPKNYDPAGKYPVIYTLDGSSLFAVTADYVKHLGNQVIDDGYDLGSDAIPPAIVVGIMHNNRGEETQSNLRGPGFLPAPRKLYDFITQDLVPTIDSTYHTSRYNVLIGHSNTAQFAVNALLDKDSVFGGVIALSLVSGSDDFNLHFKQHLIQLKDSGVFLGYGFKDNEFNELARLVAKEVKNKNVLVNGYNANHVDLPAVALVDGIKFAFRFYRNFNDFTEEAKKGDYDVEQYLGNYRRRIEDLYGLSVEVNEEDYGYLVMESVKNKDVRTFEKLIAFDEDKNDFKYQSIILFHHYRDLGAYPKAKSLAYEMLNDHDQMTRRFLLGQLDVFTEFFRKDLELPFEAIDFLERVEKLSPDSRLEVSYFIAETSKRYKVEQKKGKHRLAFCRENFTENRFFERRDLKGLDW